MATAGSITVDLLARTGSFQSDIDRAGKELERLSKRAASASAGIDKQVASLELQAANYGKSSREATLYELALKGASTTQLKAAESALAQVDAQEKIAAVSAKVKSAILSVTAAAAALAVGAVVAFNELAKGAGKFQDLSEETGTSAENLASFALAAAGAGVNMDSVAGSMIKLTKNLTGVDDESKAAGAALGALGINVADFKRLDPADQYQKIGQALAGYADGAGKTAIAVALFGKAGAEQLKVFKQLEEQGGRQNILTAEQIALSDAYGDAQAISQKKLELYAQAIAAQALPAVTALQGALIDLGKELLNTGGAADKIGQNKSVLAWAQEAALAVAAFVDSLRVTGSEISAFVASTKTEFANLKLLTASPLDIVKYVHDGTGPLADALAERNKVAAAADKVYAENAHVNGTKIQDALKQQFGLTARSTFAATDPRRLDGGKPADTRPTLAFNGALKPAKGARSGDDPAKKELDNTLKAYSDAIRAEDDLLAQRNKALGRYNEQGLISVQSYYDTQVAILTAATTAQQADYDAQIAAATKYRDSLDAAKKPKDFEAAKGKVDDLKRTADRAEQTAGEKLLELDYQRAVATKRLGDEFKSLNAQVLELGGDLAAAAAIKFDQQYESLTKTFTANGNQEALNFVSTLRAAAVAQADLNKFARDYALITGDASIALDRIALRQQTGNLGEIEALQLTGKVRQQEIALIQQKLDLLEKIDVSARSPEQVQQVERYRLELEKLQATVDPLALKLNGIFEDSFGNAFADFISGSKSAKEAFSDFSKSVLRDISNLVSKDIAKSIFGGDGGVGGLLSGLLGGGKSGGGSGGSGGGLGGLLGSAFGGGGGGNFFSSLGSLFGGGSGLSIDTAGLGINAAGHGFSAAADSGLANVLEEDLGLFFEQGGYTGDAGLKEAAGVVHGQEFVMSAPAVRTLGLQRLDSLHRAARVGRVSLPGFESGGFVGRMPAANADQFRPRTSGMPNPVFHAAGGEGPGITQHNTFVLPGEVTRETQQQLAVASGRATKRALARAS